MKNFSAKNAEFETVTINNEAAISASDLGTAPNQIPLNKDLGSLAYQDAVNLDDVSADMVELRAIAAEISDSAVDVFVYDTSRDSDGGAWRKRTQHTSWYNEELNTATRGARREFPAVAVIVAEASKVTIYDGDDPDLSMWMVFNSGYGYDTHLLRQGISSVYVKNGTFSVGHNGIDNNSRLTVFNFIKESSRVYYGVSVQDFNFYFSNRNLVENSSSSYTVITGVDDIVDRYVNDVAMTILPNAPVDDATGLPVPTIAVATDGGVSVIRDDGTVVDITNTQPDVVYRQTNHISFTKDHRIRFTMDATQQRFYWTLNILDSDYAVAHWNQSSDNGITFYKDSIYGDFGFINSDYPITAIEAESLGNGSGLTLFDENKAEPKKSIVAYVNSKYNTGWMPGDIKLAALSDSVVENVGVNSDELVENGGFDSDISGWSNEIAVWSSGAVALGGSGGNGYIYQDMGLITGKTYVISFDVTDTSSSLFVINNSSSGSTSSTTSIYSDNDPPVGSYSVTFNASNPTLSFVVGGGDAAIINLDNISVRATTELITNGDFSNGITGWSEFETGRGVYEYDSDSGTLKITATGSNPYLGQDLPTIIGKDYVASIEVTATTASSLRVQFAGMNFYPSGVGVFSYTITATSTTTRLNIQLLENATSNTVNYDNVSVRLAEEDRSVNNNGLQIVGEINKTPVAPGADLVAYSGFSENNYLVQPYNEDLNFGTGDFCVMGWANVTDNRYNYMFDRRFGGPNGFNAGFALAMAQDGRLFGACRENNAPALFGTVVAENAWNHFCFLRKNGITYLYQNAILENSEENSYNIDGPSGTALRIGSKNQYGVNGSLALLRISATAPTPEQIAKIYRDEKVLFTDGAQATLYGTSDAVTALACDDSEQILHVGTASGRSDFRGLARVNNTTTAISNSISAAEGTIIQN
jgi:hypothetical protein